VREEEQIMKNSFFKKIIVLSIVIFIIGTSVIPIINSSNIKPLDLKKSFKKQPSINDFKDSSSVTLKIYQYNNGKILSKNTIKISTDVLNQLKFELNHTCNSNLKINDIFEEFLRIFKEKEIISNDIKLNDFIDPNMLPLNLTIVQGQDFRAHFAPILIIGGGFGFGLGEIFEPINFFLHFLALVGGLAWVFCIDPTEGVLYILQSYLLPILIGYMSSYSGLILFAIEPGFFYSNIFALGFTAFTTWKQFPSINR
jgi:hypothetical protein